jgi:nucleoside-diphosphate-sugar epimerase
VTDIPALVDANIAYGAALLQALAQVNNVIFVYAGTFFENYRNDNLALNLYAATKRAFGEIVRYYEDAYQVRSARVVMYEVYGPRDPRAKFMNAVVGASLTGSVLDLPQGDPRLDLVYVDDAADALIAAADTLANDTSQSCKEFSATSGQLTPLSTVINLVERLGGRRIQTNIGAYPLPARVISEPWRTERPPGWTPQISLEEGISSILRGSDHAR